MYLHIPERVHLQFSAENIAFEPSNMTNPHYLHNFSNEAASIPATDILHLLPRALIEELELFDVLLEAHSPPMIPSSPTVTSCDSEGGSSPVWSDIDDSVFQWEGDEWHHRPRWDYESGGNLTTEDL
ncbi:hypothetical protein AX16_006540 [Volvariella volvacea WC 439]|nr:hypothetical protein AX16_006540 [Volvariella volvacea WC 439]